MNDAQRIAARMRNTSDAYVRVPREELERLLKHLEQLAAVVRMKRSAVKAAA